MCNENSTRLVHELSKKKKLNLRILRLTFLIRTVRTYKMNTEVSPRKTSSKRNIRYCKSSWKVHEFEVWRGELICRAVALLMKDSLFIWLGGREPHLLEVAVAMPSKQSALATTLLGDDQGAASLAQRLSAALGRQVYVSSGKVFDRFTLPLVESGIIAEVKKNPDCF